MNKVEIEVILVCDCRSQQRNSNNRQSFHCTSSLRTVQSRNNLAQFCKSSFHLFLKYRQCSKNETRIQIKLNYK